VGAINISRAIRWKSKTETAESRYYIQIYIYRIGIMQSALGSQRRSLVHFLDGIPFEQMQTNGFCVTSTRLTASGGPPPLPRGYICECVYTVPHAARVATVV